MSESIHTKRTIIKKQISSQWLTKTRGIRIYLPPGYNVLNVYPVIYCQDGEQFLNFGRIATRATELIMDEEISPVIIVGVDVDLSLRTSEYAPEGDRFVAYCRFFAEELVPFIEKEFSVSSSVEGRILAGDSLGATVALHLALDYPDVFHNVLSFSGAFKELTQARIAEEHSLSQLNLYMLVGLEETEVTTDRGTFNFLEMNRETKKLLTQRQATIKYAEEQGTHKWGFWQLYMADGLRYFLGKETIDRL